MEILRESWLDYAVVAIIILGTLLTTLKSKCKCDPNGKKGGCCEEEERISKLMH